MSKKHTIAVIDDTEDILEALDIVLTSEGFKVVTSTTDVYISDIINGKKELPDLILLDVLLSGQDGRLLVRALKNEPDTAKIPIVMMSAHPNVEKSIRESGADDFLSKPFEIDDLIKVIKKNLK